MKYRRAYEMAVDGETKIERDTLKYIHDDQRRYDRQEETLE